MKRFDPGEVVEVQVAVNAPWTTTTYKERGSARGHHVVEAEEHPISLKTGEATTVDDPNVFMSRVRVVPSRRIRLPAGSPTDRR